MMSNGDPEKKKYQVGDETYIIFDNEVDEFSAAFPDAKELSEYSVGEESYWILPEEVEEFSAAFPDAALVGATPKEVADTPEDNQRLAMEQSGSDLQNTMWHEKQLDIAVDPERLPKSDEKTQEFWGNIVKDRQGDVYNATSIERDGGPTADETRADYTFAVREHQKATRIAEEDEYPLEWLPKKDDQKHQEEFIEFYKDKAGRDAKANGYDNINKYFRHGLDEKYTKTFIPDFLQDEYAAKADFDHSVEKLSQFMGTPNEALTPDEETEYRDKFIAEVDSAKKKLQETRVDRYDKIDSRVSELDEKIKLAESEIKIREDESAMGTLARWGTYDFDTADDLQEQITNLNYEKDYILASKNLLELSDAGKLDEKTVEDTYGKIPGDGAEEKLRNYYHILLNAWKDQAPHHRVTDAADLYFNASKVWDTISTGDEGMGFAELEHQLATLAPMVALQRSPIESDDTATRVFSKTFSQAMMPKTANVTTQSIAQNMENALGVVGGKIDNDALAGQIDKIGSPYEHFSDKDWASMAGTTTAIMAQMLISDPVFGKMMKVGKLGKFLDEGISTGALFGKGDDAFYLLGNNAFGRGVTKSIFQGTKEGLRFETSGTVFEQAEGELNFWSGFFGGALSSPVNQLIDSKKAKDLVYAQMIRLFGNKTDDAVRRIHDYGDYMMGGAKVLAGRPQAEVWEEFGNELGNMVQESENFADVAQKIEERFGPKGELFHFAVSSYMMGLAFGGASSLGQAGMYHSKQSYNSLSSEDQQAFRDLLSEISDEFKAAEEFAVNENLENAESTGPLDNPATNDESGESIPETDKGDEPGASGSVGSETESGTDEVGNATDISDEASGSGKSDAESSGDTSEALVQLDKSRYSDMSYKELEALYDEIEENGAGDHDLDAFDEEIKRKKAAQDKELKARYSKMSDKDLDAFWEKAEGDKSLSSEFYHAEKEMEARENASVYQADVKDIPGILDALDKKDQETSMTFSDRAERNDVREVLEDYANPEEVLDEDLITDFRDAYFHNWDTHMGSGIRMKMAVETAKSRGMSMNDLASAVLNDFRDQGLSPKEAMNLVQKNLSKLTKGVEQDLTRPAPSLPESTSDTLTNERTQNLSSDEQARIDHLESNVSDYLSNQKEYQELFKKAHGRDPFSTKAPAENYTVESDGDKLVVKDDLGQVVTDKDKVRSALKGFFRQEGAKGRNAGEVSVEEDGDFEYTTPQDYTQEVIEKSENPQEIAQEISNSLERSKQIKVEDYLDPVEAAIQRTTTFISEEELIGAVGYGRKDLGAKGTLVKKNKKSGDEVMATKTDGFDAWAQDAAADFADGEMGGEEVTKEDVIDYVLKYPNGAESIEAVAKDQEAQIRAKLRERFEAITGAPASPAILEAAMEATLEDVGVDTAVIDAAVDQDFASQEELEEYYNNEFEKHEGIDEGKLAEVFANGTSYGSNESTSEKVSEPKAEYGKKGKSKPKVKPKAKPKAKSKPKAKKTGTLSQEVEKKIKETDKKLKKATADLRKKKKDLSNDLSKQESLFDEDSAADQESELFAVERNTSAENIDKILQPFREAITKLQIERNNLQAEIDVAVEADNAQTALDEVKGEEWTKLQDELGDIINNGPEFQGETDKKSDKKNFGTRVAKMIEALKAIAPNLEITVLNSQAEYERAARRNGATVAESKSTIAFHKDGKIYLNAAKSGDSVGVAFHEGIHPVVSAVLLNDQKRLDDFYDTLASDPALKEFIDYAKNHPSKGNPGYNEKAEAIVEFLSAVAEGRLTGEVKVGTLTKIKQILQAILDFLGIKGKLSVDLSNEKDLMKFAGKLAAAFESGMKIQSPAEKIKLDGMDFMGEDRSLFDSLKHWAAMALKAGVSKEVITAELKSQEGLDAVDIDELVDAAIKYYFNDDVGTVSKAESVKRIKHKLVERLEQFGEMTAEEKALFDEGVSYYDQVGWKRMNEKVDAFFEEIMRSANTVVAFDQVFAAIKTITLDQWGSNKELATFVSFVLQRLMNEHRRTGRLQQFAEVFTWLNNISNSAGQHNSALQQGSSAEALANRATDRANQRVAEALGEDGEAMANELMEQVRKLQAELAEALAKNTALDKVNDRLANAEGRSSGVNARVTNRKAQNIARKIQKIISLMKDDANSAIPVPVVKGALQAVSDALLDGKTLLEAVEAGANYVKFTEWYGSKTTVQRRAEMAAFRSQVSEIIGLSDIIKSEIKAKARHLKLKIGDLVKAHLAGDNSNREQIVDKLIEEIGLTRQEAVDYVRVLNQEIEKILRPKLEKKVAAALEKHATGLDIENTEAARNTVVDKMLKQILGGALSDTNLRNSFSEMFGFTAIDPEVIAAIEKLAELAVEFGSKGQVILQKVALDDMVRLIRLHSVKDAEFWYSLLNDMLHMNALSGINTQFNANFGLFLSATPNMIAYSVGKNPRGILFALTQALSKNNIGAMLGNIRSAIAENRTTYDDYGQYIDGRTSNNNSPLSDFVVNALGEALSKIQASEGIAAKAGATGKALAAAIAQGYRLVFMLKAADAAFADFATEYIQALDVYEQGLSDAGVSFFKNPLTALKGHKGVEKLAKEALALDDKKQAKIERQVDQEIAELAKRGITVPKGYRAKRIKEVGNEFRDRSNWKRAVEMAKEFALLGKPKGGFGMAYQGLEGLLTPKFKSKESKESFKEMNTLQKTGTVASTLGRLMGRGMFMFVRLMMNTGSIAFNNTPIVGQLYLLGARFGGIRPSLEKGKTWEKMPHDEFMRKFIISTTTSTMTAALFAHMFDFEPIPEDDEEKNEFNTTFNWFGTEYQMFLNPNRLIDFSSSLSGNYSKDQTGTAGERPFSMRFRSSPEADWSKPVKFTYSPQFFPGLAYIGKYRDKIKYDRNGAKLSPLSGYAGIMEATMELTFAASLQTAKQAHMKSQSDDESAFAQELVRGYVAKPLITTIQPNFLRDVVQESRRMRDITRPEGLTANEDFQKGIMYFQSFLDHDAVDMFGYKIEYESKIEKFDVLGLMTEDFWSERAKGKPEWELVHKFDDLVIEKPRKPSSDSFKETLGIKLEEEERSAIQMRANSYYGALVRTSLNKGLEHKVSSAFEGKDFSNDRRLVDVTEARVLEDVLNNLKSSANTLAKVDYMMLVKEDKRGDFDEYFSPDSKRLQGIKILDNNLELILPEE